VTASDQGKEKFFGWHWVIFFLIFSIPFQARIYKFLRPFSFRWIRTEWEVPQYFEPHLDCFISDFILLPFLIFSFKLGRGKWYSWLWEGEKKFLTLFLFLSLASIIASDFSSYPLSYWRWGHLVFPACFFYFLSQKLERKHFRGIAWVVWGTSLIESAIAIAQYFLQHSLGLKFLGEPHLPCPSSAGVSSFFIENGTLWIFDALFHVIRQNSLVMRAYGTLPHPNVLGGFMLFSLLMTYYLYQLGNKRLFLRISIFFQIFVLLITYSRSALYAWLMVTLLWIFFTSLKERRLSSLFWVVVPSFFLSLGCLYHQIFERGGVFTYNTLVKDSDLLRWQLHDLALSIIKEHPLLGIGFNNYFLFFKKYGELFSIPPTYIHNIYLYLGAEIGLLGMSFFLIFCFSLLKKGWEGREDTMYLTALLLWVSILCIGMVDYYTISTPQARLIFFLTAATLSSRFGKEPSAFFSQRFPHQFCS